MNDMDYCICGHIRVEHSLSITKDFSPCKTCFRIRRDSFQFKFRRYDEVEKVQLQCYEFKLDNLKYLQQIYETNHK